MRPEAFAKRAENTHTRAQLQQPFPLRKAAFLTLLSRPRGVMLVKTNNKKRPC